ncbi:outer membrane protein assembly factor BamB family protein [Roseimaritima sediminicola]|uniref:outer membrane protein assembly factor BamB family protein n=1 Tax=Roseimaritima sediminicola TaxID=2662066 RepID=UPI001298569D|nr:PQQ-binding-like beta-propeller repeat protein [Roseimaritima sediminicola]
MLANELIDLLERRGLLDQEIIEALRDQLAQSGRKVTPETVAKLLVDNEHLTRFQATKLIGELRAGEYGQAADADEAETIAGALADDLQLVDDDGSSDGELAEVVAVDDADELAADDQVAEVVAVDDDAVDAVPIDADVMEAEPVDAMPVDAEPVEAVPVDADVMEAVPVEAGGSGSGVGSGVGQGSGAGQGGGPVRRRRVEEKNVWDSFKIYGVAGIILLLLLGGFALWWIITSQDSSEFIANADSLYDASSFPAAREQYEEFVYKFSSTDPVNASKARVRVATTQIYEAVGSSDPTEALSEAKRLLPGVEDEEAMQAELPALADNLVTVGENIANRAEKVSDTEEKKQLLAALDELLQLTQNAKYVSSALRQNLATRLTMLNEARARINRSINRNVHLADTLVAMRQALDQQATKQAYDARKQLLRDYPELTGNEALEELIVEASAIQQQLVSSAADVPETFEDDLQAKDLKTIVLTNRTGSGAPGLVNQVVYFQVRGSVLAFAADTGKNLWRRFVGYRNSHLPTPLGELAEDGVLLSDGARAEVQRLSGTEGELQWRTVIGEPFNPPQVEDEDVYVSTTSGRLIALDAFDGNVQWATKFPQPTPVSPGVSDKLPRIYQVGDHSNLYVIDAKNGKCIESFYTQHAEGAIRVPPVAMLGHLLVIENIDPKTARIHILRTDERGENLTPAQAPILMTGNVITPPKIQGRRLIVLSDRGEVKVLDIDTAADNEQVTVLAEQVASYDQPTATQMDVDRSQMWITGTRINRYQLQANTGKIVFSWAKHAGDSFIAPPKLIDNVLFHARVLKGTKGVRVAAVDPDTGEPRWQNDVGVPVAMLTPTTGGVHAITSQAALYMLDAEAYREGITGSPLENPGGSEGFRLRFENPLRVNDDVTVLLNAEDSGQLAVYNPTRRSETLRIVKLGVGLNRATSPPLITAGGVMLALDNGRILLKNYRTGANLGSPFQPPAQPEGTVDWYEMVALPSDAEQIVVGDDRGKLYRIRAGDQLRALSTVDNPNKFLGPMAAVDETLFATTSGPAADVLLRYDINALEEVGRQTLEGRAVWGPVSVDGTVLVRTDEGTLHALDAAGETLWTTKLPSGDVVAPPKKVDDQWLWAGQPGWLVAMNPADGSILGQTDIGEPLSAVPLPVGRSNRLFVPGSEGVIYITDMPTEVASP